VKFTRTDLISRLEAEIQRRQNDAADRNAKNTATFEERRAAYLERTTEPWREFMNTIRRRLNKGEPITSDDIPNALKGSYTGGHVAVFSNTPPDQYEPHVVHLHTLMELLRATTDEEISTASLERMGLRLTDLFRGRS
jgi:hypothetical protein